MIEPCTTPNPDALKFPVGFRLAAGFNVRTEAEAAAVPFAAAVWTAGGVAAVFGVSDFVTVTRVPGAEWEPIVAAVRTAVDDGLLPAATDGPSDDAVATARDLLRTALEEATAETREQGTGVSLRRRREEG